MSTSGESVKEHLRPNFNRSIALDFQGAKLSSDSGFLLLRELDQVKRGYCRIISAYSNRMTGKSRGSGGGVCMANQESGGKHLSLSEFSIALKSNEAIWRQYEWGDMRVGYETYLSDFEDTELLKGLPNNMCPCPHWGYLIAGRMTVRYADHEEVVKAGEVYYMAPGHTMAAEAGTVLIEFSPKEEFRKLTEMAEKNFAKMQKKDT